MKYYTTAFSEKDGVFKAIPAVYYNWRRSCLLFTFNVSSVVQYRRAGLWNIFVQPRCILEMFHFSSFTVLQKKEGGGIFTIWPP